MVKQFLSQVWGVCLILAWCIVALALLAWAIFLLVDAWPLILWAAGIDLALFHLLVVLPVPLVAGLIRGLHPAAVKGGQP